MAYWGQAMALGPNLNAPLTPENGRLAHDAITRAVAALGHTTDRERSAVQALAARYAVDPSTADRKALDTAYANAMRVAAARFPTDPDVQTFYADAVMNVSPWDYWDANGRAKSGPALAISALEGVLARHPDHAGALHYHIHALEASNEPERAESSADRLAPLMPAAGHMVHMPAHIYIRVGRYKDAAEANERAIAADEDYLAQCQAQGLYPVSYYPHNLHFLWAAATLEGRAAVAIDAARMVATKVPHHHAGALAWTADFPVTPLLAYARFGRWRDVLTEPRPPANEPYAIGIWHYARALAFVGRRDVDRAAAELAHLEAVMSHEAFKTTLKELPLLTNLDDRVAHGGRRARGPARTVRRGRAAVEGGRHHRGWHPVQRAARLASPAPPGARCRAPRGRPAARGGNRLSRGSAAVPRKRLVAVRPRAQPRGRGARCRRSRCAAAIRQGVEPQRRRAALLAHSWRTIE